MGVMIIPGDLALGCCAETKHSTPRFLLKMASNNQNLNLQSADCSFLSMAWTTYLTEVLSTVLTDTMPTANTLPDIYRKVVSEHWSSDRLSQDKNTWSCIFYKYVTEVCQDQNIRSCLFYIYVTEVQQDGITWSYLFYIYMTKICVDQIT